MATEKDSGRDIKLTLGLVAGVIVVVAGGGYFMWSWLAAPPPAQSRVDINRVAMASKNQGSESAAYRELLQQSNRDGATNARSEDKSFVASIALDPQPNTAPVTTQRKKIVKQQAATSQARTEQASANSGDPAKREERRQKSLDDLLKKIDPQQPATRALSVATDLAAVGGVGSAGGGAGTDRYQQWASGIPGGVQKTAMSSGQSGGSAAVAGQVPIEIIPPYWRGPGVIDIGIDSDNSTTPVLGKLQTGPYAGAVLKTTDGAKLAGDGVVIHFTEMAFKGVNYKVDAYALSEDKLLANVATDVDHRYMSRIVLPALLSGVGNIGEMYAQANTQVVTNGFSTQTVRPGVPDGSAVLGAVAGGAAGQAAKVLSEDAARSPATQVTVKSGQVVAIQFMRGVYSGDAVAPGEGGEAVKASVPASSTQARYNAQPVTAQDWRSQAQTRIDEQRRLLESRE